MISNHPAGDDKTLLMLTYAFPPDRVSGVTRPGYFARYLPEYGYRVRVIAARGEGQPESYGDLLRVPVTRSSALVSAGSKLFGWLQRWGLPYDDRLPWVPHAAAAGAGVIRRGEVSVIFSTSPFLCTHFAALWLKRRHRLAWVADFRDPLQDNPFRDRRWFFPYDPLVERLLVKSADFVIVNTDTVAEVWKRRYPQWSEKIDHLWNGYDPEEAIPTSDAGESELRLLAHVGSLYGDRTPSRLLHSIRRLLASGRLEADRFRLRLVGSMEEQILERNRTVIDALSAAGVLICQNQLVSREESLHIMAGSNGLLLLDINSHNAALQVPAKLYDYIRLGLPILAFTVKNSPTERILGASGLRCLCIYPEDTDEQTDAKVAAFLRMPAEPQPASDWFRQQFDARNLTRRLAERLDRLTAG